MAAGGCPVVPRCSEPVAVLAGGFVPCCACVARAAIGCVVTGWFAVSGVLSAPAARVGAVDPAMGFAAVAAGRWAAPSDDVSVALLVAAAGVGAACAAVGCTVSARAGAAFPAGAALPGPAWSGFCCAALTLASALLVAPVFCAEPLAVWLVFDAEAALDCCDETGSVCSGLRAGPPTFASGVLVALAAWVAFDAEAALNCCAAIGSVCSGLRCASAPPAMEAGGALKEEEEVAGLPGLLAGWGAMAVAWLDASAAFEVGTASPDLPSAG